LKRDKHVDYACAFQRIKKQRKRPVGEDGRIEQRKKEKPVPIINLTRVQGEVEVK